MPIAKSTATTAKASTQKVADKINKIVEDINLAPKHLGYTIRLNGLLKDREGELEERYTTEKKFLSKEFKKTPYLVSAAVMRAIEGAGAYYLSEGDTQREVEELYIQSNLIENKTEGAADLVWIPKEVKELLDKGLMDTAPLFRFLEVKKHIVLIEDSVEKQISKED